MILRAVGWLLQAYARELEQVWQGPAAVQELTLPRLVATARNRVCGRAHEFNRIRPATDYRRPLWERGLTGVRDLTWETHYWVNTSGTTAGEKLIPVTAEALASPGKGDYMSRLGGDLLLLTAYRISAGRGGR